MSGKHYYALVNTFVQYFVTKIKNCSVAFSLLLDKYIKLPDLPFSHISFRNTTRSMLDVFVQSDAFKDNQQKASKLEDKYFKAILFRS